jgi:hypothetical protein
MDAIASAIMKGFRCKKTAPLGCGVEFILEVLA